MEISGLNLAAKMSPLLASQEIGESCREFTRCLVGFALTSNSSATCVGNCSAANHEDLVADRENCCERSSLRRVFFTYFGLFVFGIVLLLPQTWQFFRRCKRSCELRFQKPKEGDTRRNTIHGRRRSSATRRRSSATRQGLGPPTMQALAADAESQEPAGDGDGSDDESDDDIKDDGFDPSASRNTSYLNYLSFLRVCCLLFTTLAVLAALFTTYCWGLGPLFVMFKGDQITLTKKLPGDKISITKGEVSLMYAMTVIFGLVALFFSQVLEAVLEQNPPEDLAAAKKIDRTLWFKGLPKHDPLRPNDPFLLAEDEFQRVRSDLGFALEEALRVLDKGADPGIASANMRKSAGLSSRIEKIEVVPAVDVWHSVSMACRDAAEQAAAYKELSASTRWFKWWYERQSEACMARSDEAKKKLLEVVLSKKQLSGSAFVTFKRREDRNSIIRKELPKWWDLKGYGKGYSLFSFGRPPFASVTLKCEPAPHPEDVNWHYLHMNIFRRRVRFYILSACVLALLVFWHRPDTLVPSVIRLEETMHLNILNHTASRSWYFTAEKYVFDKLQRFVPQLPLLILNTAILPELINQITLLERSTRRSYVEMRGLVLYYYFLVLSTIIFPIFAKESSSDDKVGLIPRFTAIQQRSSQRLEDLSGPQWVGEGMCILVQASGDLFVQVEGVFTLQYLFCTVFLSNLFYASAQLRNQLLQRITVDYFCVTSREKLEAMEPYEFCWGWNYAWSLSVVFLALFFSVLVPATLPTAALFFFVKLRVDQHNLDYRVFGLGSENKGVFTNLAAHRLRSIVGLWWIVMGCGFMFLARHTADGGQDHLCTVNNPPSACRCSGARNVMNWLLFFSGIILTIVNYIMSIKRSHMGLQRSLVPADKNKKEGPRRRSDGSPTRASQRSLEEVAFQVHSVWFKVDRFKVKLSEWLGAASSKQHVVMEESPWQTPTDNENASHCSWNVRKNKKVIWPDREVQNIARKVMERPTLDPHAAAEKLRLQKWNTYELKDAFQIMTLAELPPKAKPQNGSSGTDTATPQLGGSGIELTEMPPSREQLEHEATRRIGSEELKEAEAAEAAEAAMAAESPPQQPPAVSKGLSLRQFTTRRQEVSQAEAAYGRSTSNSGAADQTSEATAKEVPIRRIDSSKSVGLTTENTSSDDGGYVVSEVSFSVPSDVTVSEASEASDMTWPPPGSEEAATLRRRVQTSQGPRSSEQAGGDLVKPGSFTDATRSRQMEQSQSIRWGWQPAKPRRTIARTSSITPRTLAPAPPIVAPGAWQSPLAAEPSSMASSF